MDWAEMREKVRRIFHNKKASLTFIVHRYKIL